MPLCDKSLKSNEYGASWSKICYNFYSQLKKQRLILLSYKEKKTIPSRICYGHKECRYLDRNWLGDTNIRKCIWNIHLMNVNTECEQSQHATKSTQYLMKNGSHQLIRWNVLIDLFRFDFAFHFFLYLSFAVDVVCYEQIANAQFTWLHIRKSYCVRAMIRFFNRNG